MHNAVEMLQIGPLPAITGAALPLVTATGSWVGFADLPAAVGSVGALPEGLNVVVLLGGLVFAGAGSCLNPPQSPWT